MLYHWTTSEVPKVLFFKELWLPFSLSSPGTHSNYSILLDLLSFTMTLMLLIQSLPKCTLQPHVSKASPGVLVKRTDFCNLLQNSRTRILNCGTESCLFNKSPGNSFVYWGLSAVWENDFISNFSFTHWKASPYLSVEAKALMETIYLNTKK